MYIVRYHMPDMGMMLMMTKHNGNELKRKYIIVIIIVFVVVVQHGWYSALHKCQIVMYLS